MIVTSGTADTGDDVNIQPGQAWISITSPQEGDSFVTCATAGLQSPAPQQQTAIVHWVDVQWAFPAPAIAQPGTAHTLTTNVSKQTTSAAAPGWIVRYEITSGPAATFSESGTQSIEVASNNAGQAAVQVVQQQAVSGTNEIRIQVLRPDSGGRNVVVGQGSTQVTWATNGESPPTTRPETPAPSGEGVSIEVQGPEQAAPGSEVTYRIQVSNKSNSTVRGVSVRSAQPQGFRYQSAAPAATFRDGVIQWQLGALAVGQTRAVSMTFRAEQAGSPTICASVSTAEGVQGQQCVRTQVATANLAVTVTAPETARVGDDVDFIITVTNQGAAKATGLLIKDAFDAGLRHDDFDSPIERDLGDIEPGQSRKVKVVLRVIGTGRLCNRAEVSGDGGIECQRAGLRSRGGATNREYSQVRACHGAGRPGGAIHDGSQQPRRVRPDQRTGRGQISAVAETDPSDGKQQVQRERRVSTHLDDCPPGAWSIAGFPGGMPR